MDGEEGDGNASSHAGQDTHVVERAWFFVKVFRSQQNSKLDSAASTTHPHPN